MSTPIHRPLMRCKVASCRRTWSIHPSEVATERCPCGGELEPFDLEEHGKSLSFATKDEVEARTAGKTAVFVPDPPKK